MIELSRRGFLAAAGALLIEPEIPRRVYSFLWANPLDVGAYVTISKFGIWTPPAFWGPGIAEFLGRTKNGFLIVKDVDHPRGVITLQPRGDR